MSKDMKSNISGAIFVILIIIKHYFGWEIPEWAVNYIIVPVALGAAGHVAWLVGKPETTKSETMTEDLSVSHEPSKTVTP